MTHKTLAKICLAISGTSIAYMFLIAYEGTYFGWTIFFVFLAFAILFNSLDEKEKEIEMMRPPKEESKVKDEKRDEEVQVILFRKTPNKPNETRKQ